MNTEGFQQGMNRWQHTRTGKLDFTSKPIKASHMNWCKQDKLGKERLMIQSKPHHVSNIVEGSFTVQGCIADNGTGSLVFLLMV